MLSEMYDWIYSALIRSLCIFVDTSMVCLFIFFSIKYKHSITLSWTEIVDIMSTKALVVQGRLVLIAGLHTILTGLAELFT